MTFSSFARQLLYRALIRTANLADRPRTSRMWNHIWQSVCDNAAGSACVSIHGQRAIVNIGNTYPIYSRRFPTLNYPLVELVYQCFASEQHKVNVVDVGAATGDTILLLKARCPNMLDNFYCIDGDLEFFGYLEQNVGHLPGAHLIHAMLSSTETVERSLVRTHGGTASAQGTGDVQATTLDSIIAGLNPKSLEIIKIDVDGFDGRVLGGSTQTLSRYKPAVIFEWHPTLCRQTGNAWIDHFEALVTSRYDIYIWFDKFGGFSHFMKPFDNATVESMVRYCLADPELDRHFDIVALPDGSKLDPVDLARLTFAQKG